MYDRLNKINSLERIRHLNLYIRTFKVIEGKSDPTTFLPLNTNMGGQTTSHKIKYNKNKYLTEDQARHVYKKVESGNIININTLKQEMKQDW